MKSDLQKYLLKMLSELKEMEKAMEEAQEQASQGKLSQEVCDTVSNYYSTVATNYNRVLYCIYLYTLPPKFIQKLRLKKLNKLLQKFKQDNADQESVSAENRKAIDSTKESISNET